VSREGDLLYVWTQGDSGKVTRIRNDARVQIAPSDHRGAVQGAPVYATARVLDAPTDLARVESLHKAKYGLQFRLFDVGAKVFRRNRPLCGLEITLAAPEVT
jgi:PPOX class probable F420-dependent enzyme